MFNQDLLVQISTKCIMKTYPSQTLILKQGTEPNQVYIIRSGRIKAIKRVKWNDLDESSASLPNLLKPNKAYSENYVEIDELGK